VIDLAGKPAPASLAAAEAFDRAGASHSLGACWADRPCVVVLVRHFGCIGCSAAIADLAPRLREIDVAGATTVIVGSGPASSIAAFAERNALDDKPVTILTDPSLAAYRAAGLVRSAWGTFGPRAVIDYVRAFTGGFSSRATDGDLLQQGGALVVAAGGRVVLHRVYESLGEHVEASDLVDAALALAARSSPLRV
jgi:peroxiredoxin